MNIWALQIIAFFYFPLTQCANFFLKLGFYLHFFTLLSVILWKMHMNLLTSALQQFVIQLVKNNSLSVQQYHQICLASWIKTVELKIRRTEYDSTSSKTWWHVVCVFVKNWSIVTIYVLNVCIHTVICVCNIPRRAF